MSKSRKRRRRKRKNNSIQKFWIGLGIYAAILLIFGIAMIIYTNNSLKKYEKSQPEKAMEKVLRDFKKQVSDKTLADNIELPASCEFEDENLFKEMYMSTFEGVSDYSFEKDPTNYNTEEPVYNIYADDKYVARITLKSKGEHVLLGILTVIDWEVAKIEPVFSAGTHNYTVTIPETYTFTVNGHQVGDAYKTGKSFMPEEFNNVKDYVEMPKSIEYKIEGFVNKPEIKVFNASGAEASCNVDEHGNVSLGAAGDSVDMPEDRKADAYEMAKTWGDFLTNDLKGAKHGLATIQKYLIKDSYYWNIAEEYAGSVDITFISDHTLANPGYSNIVVDKYVEYGENCYSCHIAFQKNMLLSGSGLPRTDIIDSTFYFVYYDDGVNGAHWAIVDMIATTR